MLGWKWLEERDLCKLDFIFWGSWWEFMELYMFVYCVSCRWSLNYLPTLSIHVCLYRCSKIYI